MIFHRQFLFLLLIGCLLPSLALAKIGVGVGTGVINVGTELKAGGIYDIGNLLVFNTGDEISQYNVLVTFLNGAKELKPEQSWFSFDKNDFVLDPGKGENVGVRITLPIKTTPGKYFAFVEARPKVPTGSGTVIGVAAAAKLYFTVAPSNWFTGLFYRLVTLASFYKIWIYIFTGVIALGVLYKLFRKFVHIQIGIKK